MLRITTIIKHGIAVLALLCLAFPGHAVLDNEQRISVKLDDGTDVVLYAEAGSSSTKKYFYLPPRLTIAVSDDDRPEFLFMKFITDATLENGGVSGAILHFLVKWGLTTEQEAELREIIEDEHEGELGGAAAMHAPVGDNPSFYVVSATLSDGQMTESVVTSGEAPLVPGGKAAAAARLDSNGAQLLAKTFEEDTTITDVTAVFNMAYETQLPAARGKVTIDWSHIEHEREEIHAEYSQTKSGEDWYADCFFIFCAYGKSNNYEYSYEEMHSQYSFLADNKYIDFKFEENISDERVTVIREAFINYFINSMSIPPPPAPAADDDEGDGDQGLDIQKGAKYTYDVTKINTVIQHGRQEFRMDYKLVLRWPYQVVGNLKSWYAEAVSDPHAVQSVILNDQFYQWRDLLFLLDTDAQDMIEAGEIRYATIEVTKNRNQGRFNDSLTFDEQHVEEQGSRAMVTYARGDDTNSDVYQYRIKWSFRGGHEYPENANWQAGSWEGVTVAAPIEKRVIELEGDIEELEQAGITRVTAQVRFPKFGNEEEQNIAMTLSRGEPLIEQPIYLDTGAEGYVYRLIFNHRTLGRFALPWSKRVSDDYIFASIPDELSTNIIEEVVEGVLEVAKEAVIAEAGEQLAKFDILLDGESS